MQFSAVLFDMDGVLVDTDRAIADLWHRLASDSGLVLSDGDLAAHAFGCVPEHTVETLFAPLAERDRAEVLARVRAAEPDLACEPVPHATDLVRALAAANVPLALVTGASTVRASRALDTLGLAGLFDTTVTWGEAARGKPAPDCYLLAARRLGLPAAKCLVFEDTPSGVRAATAAGATCLGVSRGDRGALRSSGACHAVPGFEAVSFRGDPAGAVLTVADTEEFHLRSTARHRPVAAATEESTEGGSPWR
ncbi:HAD family phosphatase [Streptomyces sp. ISL-10]|uniref:HAD family hydrolase n=1 Tax=Streptomyces sp. ISL-10 TaxID=2819172 RepID=UPI001BEA83C5|nr:HAD family phosphatase [Streptomyces sp. ISL-10]MBT2369951.1 HAD family phosphatase [Streptomyces sp. ISL-10]